MRGVAAALLLVAQVLFTTGLACLSNATFLLFALLSSHAPSLRCAQRTSGRRLCKGTMTLATLR